MLRYFSIFLVFLLDYIRINSCQIPFPDSCPEVNIVESFDLDRYMGTWYEYSKYPFIFEALQKCQQAVYKNEGNDTVSVVNSGVYKIINRPNSTNGTAKVIAPGQLAVEFRNQNINTPNYLILGTDYDNWVVVYSCKNISTIAHTKLLWILTRQRQPAEDVITTARQVIKDNNLSQTFLIKSTQTDCPNLTDNEDDQNAEAFSSTTTAGDDSSIDFNTTPTERLIETA